MIKTTAQITGMSCSMCESHINEVIRKHFTVKKVTSSHKKACTEILSEQPIDAELLRKYIGETGYTVGDVHAEEAKKRGFLFSRG